VGLLGVFLGFTERVGAKTGCLGPKPWGTGAPLRRVSTEEPLVRAQERRVRARPRRMSTRERRVRLEPWRWRENLPRKSAHLP
jgi:hypothetical protein